MAKMSVARLKMAEVLSRWKGAIIFLCAAAVLHAAILGVVVWRSRSGGEAQPITKEAAEVRQWARRNAAQLVTMYAKRVRSRVARLHAICLDMDYLMERKTAEAVKAAADLVDVRPSVEPVGGLTVEALEAMPLEQLHALGCRKEAQVLDRFEVIRALELAERHRRPVSRMMKAARWPRAKRSTVRPEVLYRPVDNMTDGTYLALKQEVGTGEWESIDMLNRCEQALKLAQAAVPLEEEGPGAKPATAPASRPAP